MSQIEGTPPKIKQIADALVENLIPNKSRKIYDFAYNKFLKWAQENNIINYTENVMLAYFSHLAETMKSSSLWAQYSMLKCQLNIKHDINLKNYAKLISFLKRQADGYQPKKAKVFSKEHFNNFLQNAPNNEYLAMKIVLIFGVSGACRCDELVNLRIQDIEDLERIILVKIPNTKTNKSRTFTIVGDFYLNLCRQYMTLRPNDINITRFFLKYQNGRCHRVVMGIHKISGIPKQVATFLKLPNPEEYTGHTLRRTSATLLVDNGGDITTLKRHGGWKSNNVAEGYIEDSLSNKREIANRILGCDEGNTSTVTSGDLNRPSTSTATSSISQSSEYEIHHDYNDVNVSSLILL